MVRLDPGVHQATLVTYNDEGTPTRWWKFYGTTTSPFTFKLHQDGIESKYQSYLDFQRKYIGPMDHRFELTGVAEAHDSPPPELFTDANVQTLLRAVNADKEKFQTLLNAVDRRKANLQKALVRIVNMLGPEKAGCGDGCEGCRMEMAEALNIARGALDER